MVANLVTGTWTQKEPAPRQLEHMPCKEYEEMESMQQLQRNTWARFTHHENAHLRGGVGPDMAKDLARQARARVIEIGKQMHWHREYCQECKVRI